MPRHKSTFQPAAGVSSRSLKPDRLSPPAKEQNMRQSREMSLWLLIWTLTQTFEQHTDVRTARQKEPVTADSGRKAQMASVIIYSLEVSIFDWSLAKNVNIWVLSTTSRLWLRQQSAGPRWVSHSGWHCRLLCIAPRWKVGGWQSLKSLAGDCESSLGVRQHETEEKKRGNYSFVSGSHLFFCRQHSLASFDYVHFNHLRAKQRE